MEGIKALRVVGWIALGIGMASLGVSSIIARIDDVDLPRQLGFAATGMATLSLLSFAGDALVTYLDAKHVLKTGQGLIESKPSALRLQPVFGAAQNAGYVGLNARF